MSLNKPTPKEYDHLFKILLLGDSGVGKSCFILRLADEIFTEYYISTIGVDFKIKHINLNEKEIKLQIWDVLIHPRYIVRIPYRQSQSVLIFFDLTDRESFENSKKWYQEVQRYGREDSIIALVGTKLDLIDLDSSKRVVSYDEALEFAESYDMDYIECSSKYDINISECVNNLSLRILKQIQPNESGDNVSSILIKKQQPKNDKCIIN